MSLANRRAEIERENAEVRGLNEEAREINIGRMTVGVVFIGILAGFCATCRYLEHQMAEVLFGSLTICLLLCLPLLHLILHAHKKHEQDVPDSLDALVVEIWNGWPMRKTRSKFRGGRTRPLVYVYIGDLRICLMKQGAELTVERRLASCDQFMLRIMLDRDGEIVSASNSYLFFDGDPFNELPLAERDQLETIRNLVFSEIAPVDPRRPGHRVAGFVSPFAPTDDERVADETLALQDQLAQHAPPLAAESMGPKR